MTPENQYVKFKNQIMTIFQEKNNHDKFIKSVSDKSLINKESINISKKNIATKITINYPGLKTYIKKNNEPVYDYRVSLNGIPISHANIDVDMYNKALQLPDDKISLLYEFLCDVEYNGYKINYQKYKPIDELNLTPPSQDLLDEISKQHTSLKKNFRIDGNNKWNYSLTELFMSLTWIVLQEDINYPRKNGKKGRQMPFYRYVEAIALADSRINTENYTITDVIGRTVQHKTIPTLYPELQRHGLYFDLSHKFNSNFFSKNE
ncbi:hypothetical protein Lp90_1990 [Lactiplantibacillus plantarum]|uniref:hypothetical protein n=1 Tax=Lactiplantibacillus plantarum TaxID=1590 RepID=UPI0004DCBFA5|nr:hypothetical protein [Lactiplantibacillus plantarum]KEZ13077.1 hypothetical protein Lp90_1990 [Lactiplantibacillus plantarum]